MAKDFRNSLRVEILSNLVTLAAAFREVSLDLTSPGRPSP